MVRVKGSVVRSSAIGVALGLDVRMPTGDPYNFLGSGGYGIKPFVAVSGKSKRLAPHANVAFQYNSTSVLAGDVMDGDKGKLPNQVQYVVGAEASITKRMTLAADVLGDYFHSQRVFSNPYQYAGGSFPGVRFATANLHIVNGSIGAKFNPVGRLLVTFNLLFKMNDMGLRAPVVPLFAVSYTL